EDFLLQNSFVTQCKYRKGEDERRGLGQPGAVLQMNDREKTEDKHEVNGQENSQKKLDPGNAYVLSVGDLLMNERLVDLPLPPNQEHVPGKLHDHSDPEKDGNQLMIVINELKKCLRVDGPESERKKTDQKKGKEMQG